MTSPYAPIKYGKASFAHTSDFDTIDARGYLWMWEPPNTHEHYIVSCDPAVGIRDWSRTARLPDDTKKDNTAIEVLKRGKDGKPDIQVAEYAAPIGPFETAHLLNAIGKMYGGNSDDGTAKLIVEVYPGPGLAVMQELVHTLGYTNFWMWQYIDKFIPQPTQYPGWNASSRAAQRLLWLKGHHYISSHGVKINSPWLEQEMHFCEIDPAVMRGKAAYGYHDDRIYALLMALYALHDWALMDIPEPPREDKPTDLPDFQACDLSASRMMEIAEDQFSKALEENS